MNKIKQSTLFKLIICIIICVAIAIFAVYFYVNTSLKLSPLSGVYSQGIEPDDDNLYFSFQTRNNTYVIKNCRQEITERGTFKKVSSHKICDVYQLNSDNGSIGYVVNSSKKITVLSANGISYDIKFVSVTPLNG